MKTKMKYAIIVLVALFAQSCSNEKVENGWTIDNLQGKVLSYSQFSYEVVDDRFGNIEKIKRGRKSRFGNKQKKYDEKGNLIEDNQYNSDGSLGSNWTYKYDEKGNLIEYSDGELYIKSIYKYKYDEKGNRIEGNRYNSDGSLYSKLTYKYDEKGNQIEENEYNLDLSLIHI